MSAGYVMGYCDRAANMDAFMSWLKENEVDTTAVSIAEFEIGGYGLKANHDIEASRKSTAKFYTLHFYSRVIYNY